LTGSIQLFQVHKQKPNWNFSIIINFPLNSENLEAFGISFQGFVFFAVLCWIPVFFSWHSWKYDRGFCNSVQNSNSSDICIGGCKSSRSCVVLFLIR
jgi:hypothetical protein